MNETTIFLDDGGVMNDNEIRQRAWQRLVGEYLAPRVGGQPEAWSEANKVAAPAAWQAFMKVVDQAPDAEFAPLGRELDRAWLAGMCEIVGVDTPSDDRCIALTRETAAYVTPRVGSAYPGAVEAIRQLHSRGYALGTASGEISPELDGYLTGMGVRDAFTLPLFGPDLVKLPKNSPRYYEGIFEQTSVDPSLAIVIDDAPHVLDWARSLGARTVLVTTRGPYDGDIHHTIGALRELPALIESIFP